MAKSDDTSKAGPGRNPSSERVPAGTSALQQAIDAERARLLQVSCALHCLYEVLLYAEGDEAVTCAEVAHLAANLIDESVEKLDPIRLGPMIEAIRKAGEKERSELGGPYEVREPRVAYIN
jgi:hypothetical protein